MRAVAEEVAGNEEEGEMENFAMLGDVIPPTSLNLSLSRHRHRGVRILSIDGGGTRGIGSIQTLRALQKACGGRPIYSMFDIICGTSTGGILAVALGLLRRPLDEVEQMYRNFSSRVFESSSVYVVLISHVKSLIY